MQLEYQLRTEIEFWRDALENQESRTADAVLNRMERAKNLAERKLTLFLEEGARSIN